jgi:multidrug efflux system outer membrane protein
MTIHVPPPVARPVRVGLVAAALAVVGGCRAVGPDYARPSVPLPSEFRDAAAASPTRPAPSAPSLADLPWWQVFQDPALQSLLRDGLAGNEDLRAALARVDDARARVGVAASERYPQVEAGLSATRDRASRDLSSQGSRTNSTYRGTISASWELDLWGRVRRGEEAAIADWMASRGAARRRRDPRRRHRRGVLRPARARRGAGHRARDPRHATEDARPLHAAHRRRRVEPPETSQAEADRLRGGHDPRPERRITQQENLLSFLMGKTPGPVARGHALGTAALPPSLPTGLPATLLERRPDVRAAEAEVIAANARVGVAVAEFFPRLDLLALVGLGTQELSGLSADQSSFASVGGSLLAPVFQGGRLTANRASALARREEAVAWFRRAAEDAFARRRRPAWPP